MVPAFSGVSTVILMVLEVANTVSPAALMSRQMTESPLFNVLVVYIEVSVPVFVLFSFH